MQNRASARPGKSKPQGRSGQRAGKKAGCDIIRQFRSEARAARKNSENHTGGRRLAWQAARRPFGSSCDSHVPWRARLARRLRGTNRRDVTVSQHHAHGRSRRQSLTARRSRQAQPFAISFWKTHRQVVRSSGSNEPPSRRSSCYVELSAADLVASICDCNVLPACKFARDFCPDVGRRLPHAPSQISRRHCSKLPISGRRSASKPKCGGSDLQFLNCVIVQPMQMHFFAQHAR
jgi:hypothetical protein